jgi:hypothetical protein
MDISNAEGHTCLLEASEIHKAQLCVFTDESQSLDYCLAQGSCLGNVCELKNMLEPLRILCENNED